MSPWSCHLYERPYNTSREYSGVPREWYSKRLH